MPLYSPLNQSQPIVNPDGTPTWNFVRFINNLFVAAGGGGPRAPITVSASPFVYTSPVMAYILISGGTVSKIEFSRDTGATWDTVGATGGMITMEAQDKIRVTYSVKPTIVSIPA